MLFTQVFLTCFVAPPMRPRQAPGHQAAGLPAVPAARRAQPMLARSCETCLHVRLLSISWWLACCYVCLLVCLLASVCVCVCVCLLACLVACPLPWLLVLVLLVVCVGVSLSSCCLGGCACGLFVSSVSVSLLACLSSFCCCFDVCVCLHFELG